VVCGDDGPAIRLRAPDLSSGERQRASLARAFAESPRLLLLDQPTLGLDCAAAREMRAFIRQWTDEDSTRTVVIGTNDMREASELCDRVAILDAGRVVECDTPAALTQRVDPAPVAGAGPRMPGAALLEQVFLSIVGRASVLRSPGATPHTIAP
jgi:ABC-type multidrug transport system ATPase subunit